MPFFQLCNVFFWLSFLVLGGGVAERAYGRLCDFSIKATDDIVFDITDMKIQKDCTKLKIKFKHGGSVLKHNWVLVKKSDLERIRKDGETAGEQHSFLPKSGAKVIAQTKLIDPGLEDTIEIDVAQIKKGVEYAYFCSFPGHGATMKGVLRFGGN